MRLGNTKLNLRLAVRQVSVEKILDSPGMIHAEMEWTVSRENSKSQI